MARAGRLGAGARMSRLRGRQRQRDDIGARRGETQGEAAPAAADLEHALAAFQREQLDDARELRLLRRFEVGRGRVPNARGVLHLPVEPQRVEVVAEIVMVHDVAAAAAPRVGAQ